MYKSFGGTNLEQQRANLAEIWGYYQIFLALDLHISEKSSNFAATRNGGIIIIM